MRPAPPTRRILLPILAAAALAGCAVLPENTPRNRPEIPLAARLPDRPRPPRDVVGVNAIALSFSGGGLRASAFAHGALAGLAGMPGEGNAYLLEDLSFITSVSGGSITAAWFGLHGREGLATFREAALLRDGEADLRFSLLNPLNLARLAGGGLNDRGNFHRWLEEDVFKGATYADLFRRGRPDIWINATNAYHRLAFPFHQRAFEAICSDLASLPVSEAVAASMAVPMFITPVVLQKFPEHCTTPLPAWMNDPTAAEGKPLLMAALGRAVRDFRDPSTGRYLKLIDGGITDNFGLVSILQSRLIMGTPHDPMTARDAQVVRNLLFVVVDAGQGPSGTWTREIAGPGGIDVATAAIDAAIEANVRMSFDSFVTMTKAWRDEIIRYRCALPADTVTSLKRERANWRCDDVTFEVARIAFDDLAPERARRLHAIPTRLKLPAEDIDELIAAGRDALLANPTVTGYQWRVVNAATR
ncbi:MAG: patatin-like phospholipase family protein [Betaproteobacteria bacterium]|nr:patatin-like phospholipase family protein [Betaproteobacteria bacterium]